MIWATVSSWSCFCLLYRASPSLAAKNIINGILVLTIWWCPCVESSLVLLEKGVCYDQCIFLAKLYQSLPCFILYSKAKFAYYSRCFLTSYFCIPVPYESPLDCKEIQPIHSKGDQPSDFFGRNDAKAETPVLWPPHAKSWLIGKDSDAGRDWGQKEKGTTEDEMAGWHHWLDGCESGLTQRVGDGQGGLACCDSWGRKESDTTERLNWTELNWIIS